MSDTRRDVPQRPRDDVDRVPKSPADAGTMTEAGHRAPGGLPKTDEDQAEPAPETL